MNIRSFYWYSLRIVWFPFWWEIRNLYIEYLKNTLLEKWYNEWHFTDFLNKEWVDIMCNNILNIKSKIYSINSISKNWWKKEYFLAPTHEISVSQALSRYIKYENDLPLKLFHIWPAFRKQYNSLFPFSLSKRNTYFQCHSLQKDSNFLKLELNEIIEFHKNFFDNELIIPYIYSERPLITNNPVSKKTFWFDVITPLNRTLHSWMVYLQEDFFVKYKDKNGIEKNPLVIHYGFTDNLLLAIILNWVNLWNWKQIFLPHILMPYHVFFTSDNIRKFWYDIEKIKKLWFRVKFLNTFDFWDSRNKKIIKSINNYNPYIHIKWKNNWEYIYRILWDNTWRENNDLKKFSEELFINSEKAIIFDWPITQYLNCNIKNKNNINHIILLNKKEQLNFFWKDYSNDIYVSRMDQKLSSYIVLKWEYTPIFLPDWQKIIRYSWWCKELVVAWSWDLLLWYISWFVAQSFDLLKSIEISIDLRERSSKYYIEKTNDIIALPSDIVENTRFVINNLIKKYE